MARGALIAVRRAEFSPTAGWTGARVLCPGLNSRVDSSLGSIFLQLFVLHFLRRDPRPANPSSRAALPTLPIVPRRGPGVTTRAETERTEMVSEVTPSSTPSRPEQLLGLARLVAQADLGGVALVSAQGELV